MKSLKIRHFRLIFHSLIVLVSLMPIIYFGFGMADDHHHRGFAMPFILPTLLIVPIYLLNVYYFVPSFLSKRKYLSYGVVVVVSLLLFSLLNFAFQFTMDPPNLLLQRPGRPPMELINFRFPPVWPFFMMLGVGTSFEMILNWENQQSRIALAEKEKLETELRFLRTQINPHFFFNTLNSIYSLAIEKSDQTQEAILLLSNLMRYILYESNTAKVRVEQELDFLRNYIALQQIRMDSEIAPSIKFTSEIKDPGLLIAPLLLIPIVENAFKYCKSYNERPKISIVLTEFDKSLIFHVSNTIGEIKDSKDEFSGIGLENISRRLRLIYPNQHHLSAHQNDGFFVVDLSLKIDEVNTVK